MSLDLSATRSAGNAVLAALHRRLAEHEGLAALLGPEGLSDRLPGQAQALPMLRLGEMQSRDYSASHAPAMLHAIVLEVWSEGPGRREALAIADSLAALLDAAPENRADGAGLSLSGHHLVTLQVQEIVSRMDGGLIRARLLLRAVTEPLSPPGP